MISFVDVTDNERTAELVSGLSAELREYAEMLLDDFRAIAREIDEAFVCISDGCMLVRVLDGGDYMFIFPIMLSEEGDTAGALVSLSEYVRREMIPFFLTDVPRECLDLVTELFPHTNAKAYEDDEDTFAVVVLNELDIMDTKQPMIKEDDVCLYPICSGDEEEYARLCSDRELNRYWGYDDLADNPTGDAEIFMATALREMMEGIALSLAIKRDGVFLGEAVIHDFDFRGGAEIGIRLLPEYHNGGVGGKALDAVIRYCGAIGLSTVRARVMEENIPAIRMTKKRLVETKREDGVVYFFAPVTGFELE